MPDLAELGLRITSEEVATADARLDKLATTAGKAESSTDRLSDAARRADGGIGALLASIDRTTREMLALQQAHRDTTQATTTQAAATAGLTSEVGQASTAGMLFRATWTGVQTTMGGAAGSVREFTKELGQADAHMQAYLAHMSSGTRVIGDQSSHMDAYRQHLLKVKQGMGLTAAEGLNLSRQFADIGVTAASGMSPLMIALQQGPQVLDIFQQAAVRTGRTVKVVAAESGAAIWRALAPLLPFIIAIGVAVGAMAIGWGLATRSLTKDIGDVGKEMGLTKDQLDKLKEKGVSTTATAGDAFKALGTTIKEMFRDAFGPQLDWVVRQWNAFLDGATRFAVNAVAVIAAAFIGTYTAIRDNWKNLPAIIGDAAFSAANLVIRATTALINKAADSINVLLVGLRALAASNPQFGWAAAIGNIQHVDLAQIGNPYSGAAGGAIANIGAGYVRAFDQAKGAMRAFYAEWKENTEATRRAAITGALGDDLSAPTSRAEKAKLPFEKLAEPQHRVLNELHLRAPGYIDADWLHLQQLKAVQDELRLIDDLARDAGRGMADAFGEAGRAAGDLLSIMSDYQAKMADLAVAEAEGNLTSAQAARARGAAEVQAYGDSLSAAKGFFREGSDGYQALAAAERAFRLVQFAMSVQAIALGGQETAFTVGQNLIRAASHGVVAIARALASLPFPFNLAAGAATAAALAAIGVKLFGGSHGGSGGGLGASVSTAQAQGAHDNQVRTTAAQAIAQQQVNVVVTADRQGMNAYVARTARTEAAPLAGAAYQGSVQTSREAIPAEQQQRGSMMLRSGRR